MEKRDLLGVRKRPQPPAAAKRRRRVVAPAKAGGGGGAGGLAKAIAAYLASDSYMYAPLVAAPPSPPPPPQPQPPSAVPPISSPGIKNEHFLGNMNAIHLFSGSLALQGLLSSSEASAVQKACPFVVVIKDADHVKGSADNGYVDGSRLMPSTCYMGCDLSMVDSPNHSIAETHAHTWMGSRCCNKATQPLGAVSLRRHANAATFEESSLTLHGSGWIGNILCCLCLSRNLNRIQHCHGSVSLNSLEIAVDENMQAAAGLLCEGEQWLGRLGGMQLYVEARGQLEKLGDDDGFLYCVLFRSCLGPRVPTGPALDGDVSGAKNVLDTGKACGCMRDSGLV